MDPTRFDDVRCQHSGVLAAVEELETALASNSALLALAVERYLAFHRGTLVSLMREEEGWLGALIEQHLPAETVSAAQLRREHETIELLASALSEGLSRRASSSPADADSDLAATVSDLCLLVRDHIRREDAVLRPLLLRLAGEGSHRGSTGGATESSK